MALVTGGAGFVGRHMVKALEDWGYDCTVVDLKWGAEVRNFFRVSDWSFDLVVHLAALVGGRLTIEGKPLAVAEDLAIDAEFFNWCLRKKPKRVVYFSSSAAYPVDLQSQHAHAPLLESDIRLDDVRQPDAIYGWVKLTGEQLAPHLRAEGIATHVLRPFSGYGADQDYDYPFPSFIARAIRRDDPFVIWGTGEQVRDFIHIDDVVAGTLAVIDQDVQQPLNLGTGRPTSFLQLQQMVCAAAFYQPQIALKLTKPVGCWWRVADTTLMEQIYTPKITLEDGIKQALEWSR